MRHVLAVFLLGGIISGILDIVILAGVSLASGPIADRVLKTGGLRRLLGRLPWIARFAAGFGVTYFVGLIVTAVYYQPLGESEFFPLVLTVAVGLIVFQILLADTGEEEDEEDESAGDTPSPSVGGAVGAALVIFAVGAMLLAFPGTALADNCSGLFDCNAVAAGAAAAAAGAAAAAAGAAANRNQNKNKKKKRRKKKPTVEVTVGPITQLPPDPEVEVTVGPITELPPDPEVEVTVGPITEIPSEPPIPPPPGPENPDWVEPPIPPPPGPENPDWVEPPIPPPAEPGDVDYQPPPVPGDPDYRG